MSNHPYSDTCICEDCHERELSAAEAQPSLPTGRLELREFLDRNPFIEKSKRVMTEREYQRRYLGEWVDGCPYCDGPVLRTCAPLESPQTACANPRCKGAHGIPAKLIYRWDYGSPVTLSNGESIVLGSPAPETSCDEQKEKPVAEAFDVNQWLEDNLLMPVRERLGGARVGLGATTDLMRREILVSVACCNCKSVLSSELQRKHGVPPIIIELYVIERLRQARTPNAGRFHDGRVINMTSLWVASRKAELEHVAAEMAAAIRDVACGCVRDHIAIADRNEAPRRDLNQLIFEAIGEASMCWSDVRHAGVFNSTRAVAIGERLQRALAAAAAPR